MTISAALQTRYSTETDQDWWQGLILSHSLTQTLYLCDQPTAQVGLVDGVARTFAPVPFRLVEPTRDSEGLQQVALQICAIESEASTLLGQAIADPTERIRCRWGLWLIGDTAPQRDPLPELSLTRVDLTETVANCTAQSADILSRPFPGLLYRIGQWPGLDRR